jgi:hypothetical protein
MFDAALVNFRNNISCFEDYALLSDLCDLKRDLRQARRSSR